ncbi:PRTRC system protein C [Shewanella frigidimarina]|jgi:PRTRC genetic system protein C
MLNMNAIVRKFKIGAAIISDPAPQSDLDEVQRILTQQYPMLRHTRIYIEDGVLNDTATEIIYEFPLIPVKVKG